VLLYCYSVTRLLAGYWIDAFAAAMLGLATVFSYLHNDYLSAVITALCTGVCFGVAFARWARSRTWE
jgi:hypothetical protein